jgi:hypothetical protein
MPLPDADGAFPVLDRQTREGSRGRVLRGLGFALAQLAILAAVLTLPLSYASHHAQAVRLGLQHSTSIRATTVFPRLPGSSVLQVLSFHDISPHPQGPYSLTPKQFADDMTMLVDAGYTTATAADVQALGAGHPLNGRKILITFDDGARGIWTYADPVLKRLHLHAMAFIITGRVGTHQPYYVTWPQLAVMSRSGRWDIESHTNALHTDVPVSPYGAIGPALANLRWLAAVGRLETLPEYQTRVAADLAASKVAFAAHHLPVPLMFAYPFSATGHPSNDPRVPALLRKIVGSAFTFAFDNETDAGSIGPEELRGRLLPRIEVLGGTTAAELYGRLQRTSPLSPDQVRLTVAADWSDSAGHANVTATAGRLRVGAPGHTSWQYALFGPSLHAAWTHYRLTATVHDLSQRDTAAAVLVRVSATGALKITVTRSLLRISAIGSSTRELAHRVLPAAQEHNVVIDETPTATTVKVDSVPLLTVRSTLAAGGGIGLGVLGSAAEPWFDYVTVAT